MKAVQILFRNRGWLVGVSLMLLLAILWLSGSWSGVSDYYAEEQPTRAVEQPFAADRTNAEGDTTVETIRTLIAQLDILEQQLTQLGDRTENLHRDVRLGSQREAATQSRLHKLTQRIDTVEQGANRSDASVFGQLQTQSDTVGFGTSIIQSLTPLAALPIENPLGSVAEQPALRPVFTIPANTIFFDAIALTALLGRVPDGNKVQAPFPVKLIVGRDNLVAGGYALPEVESMLLSGTAIGDWTLRCIRIALDSASFIFVDGTIASLNLQSDTAADPLSGGIGWVSDAHGLPCIRGRLITTVGREALSRIFLQAAQGFAGSSQQGQLTEITTADGNLLRSLSGDGGRFNRSGAAQAALAEWQRYLLERAAGRFDAVYSPAGQKVVVHISHQLEIDYPNQGRRLVSRLSEKNRVTSQLD